MGEQGFIINIKEESFSVYKRLFNKDWSVYTAAVFIAFLALMIFLWNGPWGIAAGYRNWGDWILYGTGFLNEKPEVPWMHTISVSNLGLLAGAFASALLSRQFRLRKTSGREYTKGIAGGILMGFGATLSKGCNVGGFYSAVGMYSIGGYAMMAGLGIGALVGLKILMWEVTYLPAKPAKKSGSDKGESFFNRDKIQIISGIIIILAIVSAFYIYSYEGKTSIGGLLFIGSLVGLTMHRSRFCFVRAFRCPFMTGESDMVKAVALSLAIYGSGVAVIKWNYIQPDMMGVYHPFVLGSLAGGIIFGIGMLLAGGCASSTLWRVGEGHTKLFTTMAAFALTNSFSYTILTQNNFLEKLGSGIYIPEILSWSYTFPVFIIFLLTWVFIAVWNEKTDKFVIF